jgi:hypothetical protein
MIGFYVSVCELGSTRRGLVLGPYSEHGQALFNVGRVRRFCRDDSRIDTTWMGFGTAKVTADHLPVGKLNDELGLAPGEDNEDG